MKKYVIYGLVQGVGFRPYVAQLGTKLHITGTVQNAGGIVIAHLQGEKEAMEEFHHRLSLLDGKHPNLPGARVDRIEVEEEAEASLGGSDTVEDKETQGIRIIESGGFSEEFRFLPPDIATCESCEKELLDPKNRRYRYPFISCISCGPRYTILKEIPYDRAHTTMAGFSLCRDCESDYTRLFDVRHFAQTIACDTCGPKLMVYRTPGEIAAEKEEALALAVETLRRGGLVAVKDIGGYHIAFDPFQSVPAKRLRTFKQRERKPFAVMFRDLDTIRNYCEVSEREEELLQSEVRPIVLLDRKEMGKSLAQEVCGTSHRIGAMLPCNPLQILLMWEFDALVMTSANRGGEPMIISDEVMCRYLNEGIDLVLANDREILTGLDDSIYQVVGEHTQVLRRARGLVPTPIEMPAACKGDTFAAGGDLKSVFAFGRGRMAYLSGHYGDLEEECAYRTMKDGMRHMQMMFDFTPQHFVCDRHPGYLSHHFATELVSSVPTDRSLRLAQHHHAHIASVMAEHGLKGPVLGVAFDGTGYGTDSTVWGGEFLLCEGKDMQRVGHLEAVEMTGGDTIAKNADLPAMCYIAEAIVRGYLEPEENPFASEDYQVVAAAIQNHIHTVKNSSAGRLFDALCALLDLSHENSYEGECPTLLQTAAEDYAKTPAASSTEEPSLTLSIVEQNGGFVLDTVKLVAEVIRSKKTKTVQQLAYEFHLALAKAVAEAVTKYAGHYQTTQIALSGGTFYNRLLLKMIFDLTAESGLRIYINEKVPVGDGGLALGQLYLTTADEMV